MIGVPKEKIGRLDEDNFWAMGDTGPCGPCTEVYFDQGAENGCNAADCKPGCECDRYIEIWNLVFMQYNRQADGEMKPLAQTGVDTGAGLERVACVLQGKKNVFDIDAFEPLRNAIEEKSGKTFASSDEKTQGAFNVLCDHVRSSSLIIADGCSPANDGRGYVLRKIMRRAILFAQKLSDSTELLPHVVQTFINDQHDIFAELKVSEKLVLSVWKQEIERFTHNLHNGQAILGKHLAELKAGNQNQISGAQAFRLYDTFGFPLELTKVIALEHGMTVDVDGFDQHMAQQQKQSKQKESSPEAQNINFPEDIVTTFVGYDNTEHSVKVLWEHTAGDTRWIITDTSPFYVESGGQVNDEGVVTINEHSYHVVDLKKVGQRFQPGIAVKLTPVETMGSCAVGDTAHCQVSQKARIDTVRNHTATHMLHAALHEFLGKQAKQAGSVVNKDYLRFDYTHHEPLSAELIKKIEDRVNEKIWADIATNIYNTTLADAQSKGVTAFFGEKYNPESVRVVDIPGFSTELCGGTHASSTGIIGCFKIVSDVTLATGTRRMVAVTGPKALALYQQCYSDLKGLSERFKVKVDQVVGAIDKQQDTLHRTTVELRNAKKELLRSSISSLVDTIDTSTTIPHLVITLNDADGEALRNICQSLDQKKQGFFFVASNNAKKGTSQFMAWTSKDYQALINHQDLTALLRQHNLRGGGKPGTIQGGGPIVDSALLQTIRSWAEQK